MTSKEFLMSLLGCENKVEMFVLKQLYKKALDCEADVGVWVRNDLTPLRKQQILLESIIIKFSKDLGSYYSLYEVRANREHYGIDHTNLTEQIKPVVAIIEKYLSSDSMEYDTAFNKVKQLMKGHRDVK